VKLGSRSLAMQSKTETGQAVLPGQDHMYPFGVIGVAPRYIPAGAVIELAGFRLGCTSTPTGIRETQAGGNRIQGHSSRGGSESDRIRGLKDLSRGGPESRTFPSSTVEIFLRDQNFGLDFQDTDIESVHSGFRTCSRRFRTCSRGNISMFIDQ